MQRKQFFCVLFTTLLLGLPLPLSAQYRSIVTVETVTVESPVGNAPRLPYQDEHGFAIAKFWLQIDKDEQLRRFTDRQNDPMKQWKITDEDWRNRDKWDAYEEAVNEMLVRTDTSFAPWTVVEGNNKYYARLKVLKTIVELFEKKLGK